MKMKNILISTLIMFIIFTISGCSTIPADIPDPGTTNAENGNEDVRDSSDNKISFNETHAIIKYRTYEEILLDSTDVILAEYTGRYEERGMYYYLLFTPIDQYRGVIVNEGFWVCVPTRQTVKASGTDISYTISPSQYKPGETYLLILEKHASVYMPYDIYLPLCNIMITDNYATMYDGSDILSHSIGTAEEHINGEIKYIIKFFEGKEQTVFVYGADYIRSTDLDVIVNETPTIAIVTPKEYIGGSDGNNTSRYLCTIDERIKGDTDDQIIIIFVKDTVSAGNQYLVMIDNRGESLYYALSSKNSVYSVNSGNIVQQVKDKVAVT